MNFPEGALSRREQLEELAAKARRKCPSLPKLYVSASMADTEKYGDESPHLTVVELDLNRPLFDPENVEDGRSYISLKEPYRFWVWASAPMVIPFDYKGINGYFFTNYWLAYAHLLRELDRQKQERKP